MTHGSFFSGIGGFDLAAEWVGWENVFHCEIEPFPRKILKYYWPKAKSYEDIKKTDFTIHRGQIDVLTGGFPCQPYSMAGQRKGKEDDRHLWPEMLRAIRESHPTWVVGENVPGIISWNGGLVFEEVCADLEAEGYEVQPIVLPAAAVGAPHRRDRVWFVAYCANTRIENLQFRGGNGIYRLEATSDSKNIRHESSGATWTGRKGFEDSYIGDNASDSNRERFEKCKISKKSERKKFNSRVFNENIADTCIEGLEGKNRSQKSFRFTPGAWDNFPTQPPICSRDDGISSGLDGITFPKWRNESIKGFGNAIVPQVAYEIFTVIEQMN